MNASSFDPVYVTEGIALDVPLTLTIAGALVAAVAVVVTVVVRRWRRRNATQED